MESIWEVTSRQRSFPTLDKTIYTDVLIIGGGLCGVLCAYMLKQAGVDYTLVEAETICSGVTKNTTAKITSQHGLIYDNLIKRFGIEKARQYLTSNQEALGKYANLCKKIDCDFEYKDNYVYSRCGRHNILLEVDAVKSLGFDAELCEFAPLPFDIAAAIKFPNQAQFNPLKFVYQISKGLNIYEHTRVRELVGSKAVTSGGNIYANKIIVATHFPFINKHGFYFLKLYQHRSYVIALKNAPCIDGMYVDEQQTGLSFRNYKDLLLLGGGDHRTGKQGGGWQELRDFAKIHYPEAKECFHWATQDCMSLDEMPYIGAYSPLTVGSSRESTADMYVATGFNKWGMTSSMVAASILADMVQLNPNPYTALYSPSRSILRPQLAANIFESTINLLTPCTPRCPHLGCALKWNPHEHTWDCPCHGSRFTEDGKLIDNPATGNLKF